MNLTESFGIGGSLSTLLIKRCSRDGEMRWALQNGSECAILRNRPKNGIEIQYADLEMKWLA